MHDSVKRPFPITLTFYEFLVLCHRMDFICFGVYLPDGGQSQCIGLSPDVYIPRMTEGIRDGRDELMKAVIRFLFE